ncbi:hypothetical protein JOC77_003097 [Peribacillus deserti]|uniref:YtxH domain-containing protein n=1 Tax=Peribacillus deserti TaxID=673318 RepID=A0ABS2QMG3_9BACI|nr:hypothetical protein [Peribacillus deserti]MBM7693653.1 hypothetical protein [Peribacillus deserti]
MENVGQGYRTNSKLLRGLMYGALAGGMIAMFDRNTRLSFMDGSGRTFRGMKSFLTNPLEGITKMGEYSSRLRSQIEEISEDINFISEKVDELKEVPIQVAEVVMETKDVFTHDGSVPSAQYGNKALHSTH